MVIAAFAGTGKTYFSQMVEGAVDFECMPYKYFLPKKYLGEGESLKADFSLEMNPMYPYNYIEAIMDNLDKYKYLVIASDIRVLRGLQRNNIHYILCYPCINAKDEYEKRYINRGNSYEFLEVFIGRWDNFMKSLRADTWGMHIELKENQYLIDVKEEMRL